MNLTKKYNIVALIGEAGSGKDFILKNIINKYPNDFYKVINCTTRPIREGETEGVNYYYLSNESFAEKLVNGSMIEAAVFGHDWAYGTCKEHLNEDKVNIGVFNPQSIEILLTNPDVNLIVFKINTTDKNRLLRQLNREENPNVEEIIRRFKTDIEDFYDLDFDYIELKNNNLNDLDYAIKTIVSLVNGAHGRKSKIV